MKMRSFIVIFMGNIIVGNAPCKLSFGSSVYTLTCFPQYYGYKTVMPIYKLVYLKLFFLVTT